MAPTTLASIITVRDESRVFLYWAGDGFALWHRRLERGTFRFPRSEGDAIEVSAVDVTVILEGIDLAKMRRRPRFERQFA